MLANNRLSEPYCAHVISIGAYVQLKMDAKFMVQFVRERYISKSRDPDV